MEFLSIIALAGLVFLFIWISNLSNKIGDLEFKLRKLSEKPEKIKLTNKSEEKTSKNISNDKDLFPWDDFPSEKSTRSKAKNIKTPPEKPFKLEEFLLKKVIPIAGVITVILAVGFGVSLAFSNGLIGPVGRIALGIIFSILVLGLGEFLRPKYPKFFDKISATGIGGLLITIYFARNYDFADLSEPILTSNQTFIASVIIIATGIFLSLRYNARFLANFTILGGLIAPLMVNSDPNPTGLLSYLAILSVAGFIISLSKKWPEILGILFVGLISYEIGLLSLLCTEDGCNYSDKWFIWYLISPVLFLIFTFSLHFLIGSGGVIRNLKNNKEQKINELNLSTTFEVLLFVFSIFSANLIGYFVFKNQEWAHFGFFVLAQGFGFFFLSEIFKHKKLEIFKEISLSASIISILFATIWEITDSSPFVLTMLLTVEGILLSFVGKNLSERIFLFFGRLALIFSVFYLSKINEFSLNTIAVFTIISGLLYSIDKPKNLSNKIWAIVSVIISSLMIIIWSFETLPDFIGDSVRFLSFVLPTAWSIVLAYSIIKTKNNISRILGLCFIAFLCFIGLDGLANSTTTFESFSILILLLIGSFSVLSSFFLDEKELQTTFNMKRIATISVLTMTTAIILFFGGENLDEPIRTLFWVVWGGLLFGLGISKKWPHFRYFGLGMFFFLIAKIYLVDVWDWETLQRFLAFFCLGIALLGISFSYYKKQD